MRSLHLLVVAVLAVPSLAQNVILVQGGGANLQQAVNTANPGDTLDVMPGNYTGVTVTRGMAFLLRPGVQIAGGGGITPVFTVNALPGSDACVISGGQIESLTLSNCTGAVVISGVRMGGTLNSFAHSYVDNCTGPVVWQDCGGVGSFPLHPIIVNASTQVSILRANLIHVIATNSNLNLVNVSCPRDAIIAAAGGMQITGGRVSVAGGYFEGGLRLGTSTSDAGISVSGQGHLVITGGAAVRVVQATPGPPPQVSAIEVRSGSVWIDPSVSSIGTGGAPPVGGPGTVTNKAIPSVVPTRSPGGAAYQLAIAAEPGAWVFTLIGLPRPVWLLPFGDVWLSDLSPILMLHQMPASGTATYSGSLQNVPLFLSLVVQSVALTPSNDIVIGVPARMVWN